jgi:hypothetical protein
MFTAFVLFSVRIHVFAESIKPMHATDLAFLERDRDYRRILIFFSHRLVRPRSSFVSRERSTSFMLCEVRQSESPLLLAICSFLLLARFVVPVTTVTGDIVLLLSQRPLRKSSSCPRSLDSRNECKDSY